MDHLVFDRQSGRVCRGVLLKGTEVPETPTLAAEFLTLPGTISEALLRHDGLCFSIYGENTIAPLLAKLFGVDGLVELLDQGAIKFHLQDTTLTYLQSDVPGIRPLQTGTLNSDVHCDPAESAKAGLRSLKGHFDNVVLEDLAESLSGAYVASAQKYESDAISLGYDAYANGHLESLGLPFQGPVDDLPADGRAKLCEIASIVRDFSVVSDLQMETVDDLATAAILRPTLESLGQAKLMKGAEYAAFQIENVPRISELVSQGRIHPSEIPSLRLESDVVKFRDFLRNTSENSDSTDLGRAYLEAIGQTADGIPAKFVRTVTVWGVTTLASAKLAGAGAAAASLGLGLFDTFVFDRLRAGWKPRNYFENVVAPALD